MALTEHSLVPESVPLVKGLIASLTSEVTAAMDDSLNEAEELID